MEVKFVEIIHLRQLRGFRRFIVARVIKTAAVRRPRRVGKFHPLDHVRQIRRRPHIAHAPFLPVRSRHGQTIRHEISVLADLDAAQRHRAIGREFVRIEQDGRLGFERGQSVEHALILETVVLVIEVAPAFLERHSVTLEVPQLGQTRLDRRALRNRGEIIKRDLVLRLDPRLGRGGIVILQPAIRVFHGDAVINVHLVRGGSRGVLNLRFRGDTAKQQHTQIYSG